MTAYSQDPGAVAAVRKFLVGECQRPREELPTYADVATVYGGIARAVGPVLNSIARDCEEAGEPDLSALVVQKGSRLPGAFRGRPVEPGSPGEGAWSDELDRIRSWNWS